MRYALSGGAGFLGLHLARRLASDGESVRTLDLAPLDGDLRGEVEEIRGDVRDPACARSLCTGAHVLVHAAAALPIRGSEREIRSVNVEGTATLLAAALEAGVSRVVLISTTAVYGVPDEPGIAEDAPLVGVGAYGRSKIEAERVSRAFGRRGLPVVVLRPKTFLGPERLGVFEILFDWIREGRRVYMLGDGSNRYQLLAVEDLVEGILHAATASGVEREALNLGATRFGTVRSDLQGLIDYAGSSSRLTPVPVRPAEAILRALEVLRLSPLAEWHYRTAHHNSVVDVSKAERLLGWQPRCSNVEALTRSYDWYLENRERLGEGGLTHRVPWDQKALRFLKRLS